MNDAPAGWHTLTPRLFVDDPAALVAFLKQAFEAEGELQIERPTELRIGDSVLMVGGTELRARTIAFLYFYTADCDATFRRAVAAGAHTVEAPLDTPYGDRRAMVEDPFGNTWQIATMLTVR